MNNSVDATVARRVIDVRVFTGIAALVPTAACVTVFWLFAPGHAPGAVLWSAAVLGEIAGVHLVLACYFLAMTRLTPIAFVISKEPCYMKPVHDLIALGIGGVALVIMSGMIRLVIEALHPDFSGYWPATWESLAVPLCFSFLVAGVLPTVLFEVLVRLNPESETLVAET